MKHGLTKKHRSLLALAVVFTMLFSLNVFSFADGKMHWFYPEGDELTYHWEYEKNIQQVQFNDVAMCIEFDVADGGRQHLIKAGWLPEISVEAETLSYFNTSFYQYLDGISEYIAEADIYDIYADTLVEESGLSLKEAQEEWFTCISACTDNTYPYRIEIYNNFELYGRDIILGAYGAEALEVEEGVINGWEAVKSTIDYTGLYDESKFSEEEWENIKKSIIKNYIFLFDSESEYLICVCGTSDMDVLEKIAENLSIRETELERSTYDTGIDYLLADLARG